MFNEREEYYEDGYQHGKTDNSIDDLDSSSDWSIAFRDEDSVDSYNDRLIGYKDGKADKDDDNNTHHH